MGLLAAVVRHDDERAAWYGPGGHHGLMPVGVPANSTQKNFSLGQGQDLLHAARFQGQWRSLLTSLHHKLSHESLRGSASATTAFPDELKASQRRWGRALGTMPAARTAYCTGATGSRSSSAGTSCPRWAAK